MHELHRLRVTDCMYYKYSKYTFFFQTTKRTVPMLFVRGDGVILVSPPIRGGM